MWSLPANQVIYTMHEPYTHTYIYIWEKNIIPVLYGAATSTNRNREKCCGFGVLMASQLKISLKSVGDGFYDLAVHNKHKWMVNFFCFPKIFSRDGCDSFLCSFFFWKLIVKWRWCMVHVQYTTNSFNSMLIMLINLTFLFVWCGPWSVITNHY